MSNLKIKYIFHDNTKKRVDVLKNKFGFNYDKAISLLGDIMLFDDEILLKNEIYQVLIKNNVSEGLAKHICAPIIKRPYFFTYKGETINFDYIDAYNTQGLPHLEIISKAISMMGKDKNFEIIVSDLSLEKFKKFHEYKNVELVKTNSFHKNYFLVVM